MFYTHWWRGEKKPCLFRSLHPTLAPPHNLHVNTIQLWMFSILRCLLATFGITFSMCTRMLRWIMETEYTGKRHFFTTSDSCCIVRILTLPRVCGMVVIVVWLCWLLEYTVNELMTKQIECQRWQTVDAYVCFVLYKGLP